MSEGTQSVVSLRAQTENPLDGILREGARQMLQQAMEAEVAADVAARIDCVDGQGKRLVVRKGWHPKREIQTGLGQIPVQRPKVNDKRIDEDGNRKRFVSNILPAYLRRSKSIEELLPCCIFAEYRQETLIKRLQAFSEIVHQGYRRRRSLA